MESIFKFKKAKKMVGDFDADDATEWTLLTKPQIGNVTLFVHFHKMWCVEEQPEVPADENDEHHQPAVVRQPQCEIYYGFVKDDKFVVEKTNKFSERTDELTQKRLNEYIEWYIENGYTKDWANYNADNTPVAPSYYGHEKQDSRRSAMMNLGSILKGGNALSSGKNPHVKLGSPMVLGKTANTNKNP